MRNDWNIIGKEIYLKDIYMKISHQIPVNVWLLRREVAADRSLTNWEAIARPKLLGFPQPHQLPEKREHSTELLKGN